MILKNAQQVQKITAAFLLLAMLCINVVKLTHTHPANKAADSKGHGYANINPGLKCILCDYELTKDADIVISSFNITTPLSCTIQNTSICRFNQINAFLSFDHRGPPSLS